MADNTHTEKDLKNRKLVVTRNFDAPLPMVWRSWTESKILEQWWSPRPFRTVTKSMNFCEGGSWVFATISPEGNTQHIRIDFVKIDFQKKIQMSSWFCDEQGTPNLEIPGLRWESHFHSSPTGTEVVVEIVFTSEQSLEHVLSLGFEAGFTSALNTLAETLATNLS